MEQKPINPMQCAIASAVSGVSCNHGGPFGACIVHQGEIIATAHNTVIKDKDPTCHAEMNAIRMVTRVLGTHQLSDCILYSTAEPCPMCLAAIYWARIPEVIYALTREQVAKFGFDDAFFYEEVQKPNEQRSIKIACMEQEQSPCIDVFEQWKQLQRPLY